MPEQIIIWLLTYRYFIIIPVAIFEGPILALVSGFVLRLDYFSFWPLFLLLMAGDIIADIGWYFVGRWGGRRFLLRFGKYFSVTEESLEIAENLYHKHFNKILFFSKITMGFGFAVVILAAAGVAKIPFRKYLLYNVAAQPIWTGMLIAVGYFLGAFYQTVSKGFEIATIIAMAVVVTAALWGLSKYLRARIIEQYS